MGAAWLNVGSLDPVVELDEAPAQLLRAAGGFGAGALACVCCWSCWIVLAPGWASWPARAAGGFRGGAGTVGVRLAVVLVLW